MRGFPGTFAGPLVSCAIYQGTSQKRGRRRTQQIRHHDKFPPFTPISRGPGRATIYLVKETKTFFRSLDKREKKGHSLPFTSPLPGHPQFSSRHFFWPDVVGFISKMRKLWGPLSGMLVPCARGKGPRLTTKLAPAAPPPRRNKPSFSMRTTSGFERSNK